MTTKQVATVEPSDRIRQLAWWGQMICAVSIAIMIGTFVLALISESWRAEVVFGGTEIDGKPLLPLNANGQLSVIFAVLPALMCQLAALWFGWQLFRGYRRGEIFTQSAANHLTRIGCALFAQTPAGLLIKAYLSRIVSVPENAGGAAISMQFSITDFDFSSIAFGLMAILIGRVLGEAARLSEENKQFI
jgi:Protein of unknown function (DUF2975)